MYSITMPKIKSLPDYVVADILNLKASENSTIRKKAEPLKFPLTPEDKEDIKKLVRKYDSEKEIVGLAAPQIGISKRVIVLEVEDDQLNYRKSVWINPSYEKVNDKMCQAYEICFSVKGVAGLVNRYKTIKYTAYTMKGKMVTGKARGLDARIIQHEVDHLDGKLFIDLIPHEELITIKEARRRMNM